MKLLYRTRDYAFIISAIIHKLVMVFAGCLLPSRNLKITGDKTQRANTVNKITIPGLITCHLENLYREPASINHTLYLVPIAIGSKNHAVPSSHLDTILAKVPRPYLVLSSGNAYEIIPPGRYKQPKATLHMRNNYRMTISVKGERIGTLADILPEKGRLKMLIIAKTPAPISVKAGHYFQGQQGKMLWNKLTEYGILTYPNGEFPDDYLLINDIGITDIVKTPRDYGSEPTTQEYCDGMDRILDLIKDYQPKIIFFVYKGVLDNILRLKFGISEKAEYGFNPNLDKVFKSNSLPIQAASLRVSWVL